MRPRKYTTEKIIVKLREAKQMIFEYIEVCYNRWRLHSIFGYRTPSEIGIRKKLLNLMSTLL